MNEEQKKILQRDLLKMSESCIKLLECLHEDKPKDFWTSQVIIDAERLAEYRKTWQTWK